MWCLEGTVLSLSQKPIMTDQKRKDVMVLQDGKMEPKVFYYHLTSTHFRCGEKRILVDVANVNINSLQLVHLTRADAMELLITASIRAKIAKRLKSWSSKRRHKQVSKRSYISDHIRAVFEKFPPVKPGVFGRIFQHQNMLVYTEGSGYPQFEVEARFAEATMPQLKWACYVCGAYAQFYCNEREDCQFRFCSKICYETRPDQHRFGVCPRYCFGGFCCF